MRRGAASRPILSIAAAAALAGCTLPPVSPERAAVQCEERAREAMGPRSRIAVGASSEDGPFASVQISVSADALAGRDPLEVYETCVIDKTGAPPIRPPDLS